MAEIAIIIGNGFDLDLGLKTRYSDFMKSPEFKEIYDNSRKINSLYSLLEYLNERAELENWFDMELAIHDYVLEHNNIETEYEDAIKEEFESLKLALCKYLKRITSEFEVHDYKISHTFLEIFCHNIQTTRQFFFNYTNPWALLDKLNDEGTGLIEKLSKGLDSTTYVHGSLEKNEIVLGCDLLSGESVNKKLSFMYKYNMLKQPNHIARHIMEAKEIIFFGHSVNEMDFGYFREFFKAASASPEPARHITFITLDEKSERDIKDNIRNQGISVSDLYNNLETFEFIHTSKIYNKEKEEYKKWNNMWRRLIEVDDNIIAREILGVGEISEVELALAKIFRILRQFRMRKKSIKMQTTI